jgi:hypothetical protein
MKTSYVHLWDRMEGAWLWTLENNALSSLDKLLRNWPVVGGKAVDRGDKRTRRLRVRVLALRENPRRVRVRVLALLENPRRDRVIEPALRENSRRERVLIAGSRLETRQWTSSSSFYGLSMERGQECPLMGGWSLKPWI